MTLNGISRLIVQDLLRTALLAVVCFNSTVWGQGEDIESALETQKKNLRTISQTKEWVQTCVDECNGTFAREDISVETWETFFSDYFRDSAFTDPLRSYLWYPSFGWLSEDTHDKLQRSLFQPMIHNVALAMERHGAGWDKALTSDPVLYQTVMNSLRFLSWLGGDYSKVGQASSVLPRAIKEVIFWAQLQLVLNHPQWLSAGAQLYTTAEPWAASVRAQMWMNLREAEPLDRSRKEVISGAIGLLDLHLQMWNEYSVLLIDNGVYDRSQMATVYSFLQAVPRQLIHCGTIGTFQDWNNVRHSGAETFFLTPSCYISIWNGKPGAGKTTSEFPKDIAEFETDVFGMILAHEFNHTVKEYCFTAEQEEREKKLIEEAGRDAQNYLRSMFGGDVFVDYPQEFFASIANSYFADTAHLLHLGLKRFDDGRRQPLDQFIFFADVYSLGTNETKGYQLPGSGTLYSYPIPLERDAAGRIIAITVGGKSWRFVRNAEGKISAVTPLSLVSVVESAEGNTVTEIFEPPQRLTPSLFEFAEVNVQLLDAAGAPLSSGELHCFNHNLGLFYPDRIARVAFEDSKALIHLPLGEYTMIGTAHGMIATLRTVIAGDCSLVLRPDAIINIDTEGPVEDGQLFVVPSALRFLLPSYFMGPTQMPTSLAVSSDVPLDLTLWQPPPNQLQQRPVESFILRQTDVEPGTEVCLDSNMSALSQITYGMSNSNGLACPSHNLAVVIPPGAPGPLTIPHDATQQWDELSLYVTPGRTLLRPVGLVDQRVYEFYPEIIDLKAETIYDLRVDGQFYPSVRCRPDVFPNQLLVELPSTLDWGLRFVWTSGARAFGIIKFFEGRIPYEQDLFPTLDCWLGYVPEPGTPYRVTLNLGFFGSFELNGDFQQPEDSLVMTRKDTEHFTVWWPDCIGDRFGEYADYLEGAYHAISHALELEVSTKIDWSPLIFGAGGTGGSHFTTNLNYLKDPQSRDPACEYWKGAMAHELGHVFQGVSDGLVDFGGPSGTCKEAFASVMRDIALQEMMVDDAGLMVSLAHRENFFMTLYRQAGFLAELKRPDNPACFEEYWRYYFILSHLTDIYGPSIHGEVARAWGDPDEARNTHRLMEARGYSPVEIVCATYSTAVGEDLGWLFRLAEFDVPDGLVR